MQNDKLAIQSKSLLGQRNIAVCVGMILLISNLFLVIALFFSDKEIVLVPNSLEKESSLTKGKMSSQYMEALTRDVVNVMLNITPSNTEYAAKSILKITHPAFYGQLKFELQKRAEDVINRKISTHFFPQSITIGEDQVSVYVVGKLSTYLGKENVGEEEKTYVITYDYESFKPLVVGFQEVNPKSKDGGKSEQSKN